MAVQQQQGLIPFRMGARQHVDFVGSIPFAANATRRIELPEVGLLSEIFVIVRGTQHLGAAPTLAADGPWNLVRQLRLFLNTGIDIYRTTGYQAFVMGHLFKEQHNLTRSARLFAAPVVASAANAWVFYFRIPVTVNDGLNFASGLINLGTRGLRAAVEITWGTPADAASPVTGVGFEGEALVWYRFYGMPNPHRVELPRLNVVHRILNDERAITGVGETRYELPEQGQLLQLAQIVRINGARNTTAVDRLELIANRGSRIYRYSRDAFEIEQQFRYVQDLPVGVFVWDLFHAQNDVSQGDARDALHTEEVSTLETVTNIVPGTVLGTGNNHIESIMRVTQVAQR